MPVQAGTSVPFNNAGSPNMHLVWPHFPPIAVVQLYTHTHLSLTWRVGGMGCLGACASKEMGWDGMAWMIFTSFVFFVGCHVCVFSFMPLVGVY